MLPQGAVWQHLRQSALDTVAAGVLVPYTSPLTLEAWFLQGAFSVPQASAKRILIHASTVDIGSALLSDASFHADHAAEHAVSIRNQLACARWSSPAWTAINFYYWSFHTVVALTRLLGRTIWFVSPTAIKFLRALSATGATNPGSGPYVLECGSALSASQREVLLRRGGQTRVHDAIWYEWFNGLRGMTGSLRKDKAAGLETRLYLSMVLGANALGDSWPSALRNLLNYAPGVGYGAVRQHMPSAVYKSIEFDPASTVEDVIERFEANSASLSSTQTLDAQIPAATRVLVDLTFILALVLTTLLQEVTDRRHIDRRWINARTTFHRTQALSFGSPAWPCRATTSGTAA